MLHITNGDATRVPLERSGVPGTVASWDDILHQGPTPLATGDAWVRARVIYLASAGYGTEQEMLRDFRKKGDPLDAASRHEEVVFWFEHDLHDQLLLIRHLWWLSERPRDATRFSIVIGTDYLGLLKPGQFPERFETRRPITAAEIDAGASAWRIFCGHDPGALVRLAQEPGPLAHLPRAMRRLLEEFPSDVNGLSRTERQILDVLSEGPRSPEQAFIGSARLEDDIWMGDSTFWAIVRGLAAAPHALVRADVDHVPGRLPAGTLTITDTGRQVLAGRADHLELNAPSRWIGGTSLAPGRQWRWTGSSLRPPAP
jgi:hypothetical protein